MIVRVRASSGRPGWSLLSLLLMLAACGPGLTPDQEVRAVISHAEAAAGKRDVVELMAQVSPRYEDAEGGSAVELERNLRGYFLANPSVHLLTRIDKVEFPYRDMAKVRLTVGTIGRDAAGAATFELAAGIHEIDLEMQRERGEWKVTRARWRAIASA